MGCRELGCVGSPCSMIATTIRVKVFGIFYYLHSLPVFHLLAVRKGTVSRGNTVSSLWRTPFVSVLSSHVRTVSSVIDWHSAKPWALSSLAG
jgi:hypothetical protein